MSTPATRTRKDWEQLATATRPEGRAFIDGKLVGARDGRVFEDMSPVNGRHEPREWQGRCRSRLAAARRT